VELVILFHQGVHFSLGNRFFGSENIDLGLDLFGVGFVLVGGVLEEDFFVFFGL